MDNIKVYKMDDCEWWASKLSKEETHKIFLAEYGLNEDECPLDYVIECDIDNEGMWDLTLDDTDIKKLEDCNEIVSFKEINGKKVKSPKFGDLKRIYGEVYKFTSFKDVIRSKGKYIEPYMIASTEW